MGEAKGLRFKRYKIQGNIVQGIVQGAVQYPRKLSKKIHRQTQGLDPGPDILFRWYMVTYRLAKSIQKAGPLLWGFY